MQSTNKLIPLIREGSLELHCVNIKIWQVNGVVLLGHGVIKINKHGILYLDFVCTSSIKTPDILLAEKYPKDSLNEEDVFYLECETLDGDKLKSSHFSVEFSLADSSPPVHKYIILSSIRCEEVEEEADDNFLFIEFSEFCDIPANRSNSEKSTLDGESVSWNQTVINIDDFEISIVDKKQYTYVHVKGNFDTERVLECLKFYIGFTCGSMIQPIFSIERQKQYKVSKIHSIRNLQKNQRSSNPVPSTYARGNKAEKDFHYEIFKSIYNLYEKKPKSFDSIYSQWKRVWHSFQSENSITALTLSVAVEGLLNDIFIPKFKGFGFNDHLNSEIKRVKSLVSELDLTPDQINRLKGSISYWKNITAAKSLEYLVNLEVITLDEKKSWSNLRNSSAHPKTKEIDAGSLETERDELLRCLNLFHNLIFNVIKYSGPRYYWSVNSENSLKYIENVEITESSKHKIEPKT